MSRRYRIAVRETLRRVVRREDHVSSQLELLEVLPADQMADLLAEELVRRGFERKDGSLTRKQGGVEVAVDLETGEVTVRAASEKEIELEGQARSSAYDDAGPSGGATRKKLRKELRESLERDADREADELQSEIASDLQRALYKYTSGMNAVRLRKLLASLEGEDYPADPRHAYRQIRQATSGGQLEVPHVELDGDVGGYAKVKRRLKSASPRPGFNRLAPSEDRPRSPAEAGLPLGGNGRNASHPTSSSWWQTPVG